MRNLYLASTLTLLLPACGDDPAATETATEASSGGSTDSGPDPSNSSPTTTSDPSNPGTASASGGSTCVPGQSIACVCTSGDPGAQVCAADGLSYEPCVCEGSSMSGMSSVSNATTTPDPTSEPETTTSSDPTLPVTDTDPSESTTMPGTDTDPDTDTGDACVDPGPEPNDEPMEAAELEPQPCDGEPDLLSGVLDGDADVDWHTFEGQYPMNCGMDDPAPTFVLEASEDVRLCVYFLCGMGMTDVGCDDGAEPDMLGPLTGCCANGDVAAQMNCSGSGDESAQVLIRVDEAPAGTCVDYSVEYSYQGQN